MDKVSLKKELDWMPENGASQSESPTFLRDPVPNTIKAGRWLATRRRRRRPAANQRKSEGKKKQKETDKQKK